MRSAGNRSDGRAVSDIERCLALALVLAVSLADRLPALQCPDGTPPPCGLVRPILPKIQVLAFEARDTAHAYLASGLAEDIRAALLSTHAVVVVGPRASRTMADYVLSGTIHGAGDALTVACRLERVRGASLMWTTRLSRPAREFSGVAPELTAGALRALGVRRPVAAAPRADPVVYDLFIRARYLIARRNEPALSRSIALAREAIARDSTSPLGWVSLATGLERAGRWHFRIAGIAPDSLLPLELVAAERAVELAPADPDVRLMRALVAQDVDPTSRTASLSALRAVLAQDSANAEAWRILGVNLLEIGDGPGALAALRRAVTLDPANSEKLAWVAIGFFHYRHQYDSAAAWSERAVAADPTYLLAHAIAGQAALWRGRLDEAQAHFEAADRLMASAQDRVGQMELTRVVLARGDTAQARAYVAAAAAGADTVRPSVHLAPAMADAYLAIGDTARALWWLERYQPRRDAHYQMHLRGEPAFDGLRTNPRFQALLSR